MRRQQRHSRALGVFIFQIHTYRHIVRLRMCERVSMSLHQVGRECACHRCIHDFFCVMSCRVSMNRTEQSRTKSSILLNLAPFSFLANNPRTLYPLVVCSLAYILHPIMCIQSNPIPVLAVVPYIPTYLPISLPTSVQYNTTQYNIMARPAPSRHTISYHPAI